MKQGNERGNTKSVPLFACPKTMHGGMVPGCKTKIMGGVQMKQFYCNPYYGQEFEGFKLPKGGFYGCVEYKGDMVKYVITDTRIYSRDGLRYMRVHALRVDRFGLVTWKTESWPYACSALCRVRAFLESHPDHKMKSHEWESPFDICMYRPTNHTKRTWNVTALMK